MIHDGLDLERRILQRILDWHAETDLPDTALSLFWSEAPGFFDMAPAPGEDADHCWHRLQDTLREMQKKRLIAGTVTVMEVRDLQVGPRGVLVLKELEFDALNDRKRLLEAEQDQLRTAQKAAHDERDAVFRGKQELVQAQKSLSEVQDRLRDLRDDLDAGRAALRAEQDALAVERDKVSRALDEERAHFERLLAERQAEAAAEQRAASLWRTAGLLSLVAGGLAALFAVSQSGLI
ncbi:MULTISPECIES: hypothetical protein [unclassified Meridianimarinicoccus]|uniref:hypothetical protein n=1 Tax=unclassified Meridianimarinicoccus TaxID=2923344 RepID=UPI0018692471|nr:hypothetical protein [Fluviibacterium sp. MJW13]